MNRVINFRIGEQDYGQLLAIVVRKNAENGTWKSPSEYVKEVVLDLIATDAE